MQIAQCYIQNLRSIKIIIRRKIWDILKNIGVEEKWAQKKEELEKETGKNNIQISGKYNQN